MMALRNPRSEAGFALIEVIVAAAVLAIVALAVLSGIDGATAASARDKARTVAANLAEQDQERLRAMPIDVLRDPPQAGVNQDGIVKVDGITYDIESVAKWITDDLGGTPACGEASNQVEYLHIVTTVRSQIVGKQIPPVVVDSLVAPTTEYAEGHGALGLKVVDRTTQKGVSGIYVNAVSSTGYQPSQETTDSSGCVLFKSLPVGNYTLKVDQPGYVDRFLNQKSQVNGVVARKTISFATLQYDKITAARATVMTHAPSELATTTARDSTARYVSTTNGAFVGMQRTVASSGYSHTFDVTGLFPYKENSYTFFTGQCGYASPDPSYKVANPDYFTALNPLAAVLADPAQLQPQAATVRQPPFNLRIMRRSPNAGTSFNDGDVTVLAKLYKPSGSSDSCVEPVYQLTTAPWNTAWGSRRTTNITDGHANNTNHWVSSSSSTFDPGMPFGRYKLCIIDTAASPDRAVLWPSTGYYDNTSRDGDQGDQDINISSWGSNTTCTWPAAT